VALFLTFFFLTGFLVVALLLGLTDEVLDGEVDLAAVGLTGAVVDFGVGVAAKVSGVISVKLSIATKNNFSLTLGST
jgi:hypothetical protein